MYITCSHDRLGCVYLINTKKHIFYLARSPVIFLYPPFTRNFHIQVDLLNLETQLSNWKLRTFGRGSLKLPNQNLRQIGLGAPELWSDKQTIQADKQTTEITTLYVDARNKEFSHCDEEKEKYLEYLYFLLIVKCACA